MSSKERTLLERWARVVVTRPKAVLAVTLGFILLLALVGATLPGRLSEGGTRDPNVPAAAVNAVAEDRFGIRRPDIVVLYTASSSDSLAALRPAVESRLNDLRDQLVATPGAWWKSPEALTSHDGRTGVVLLTTRGDENEQIARFESVGAALKVPGARVELAGYSSVANGYASQAKRDLARAELLTLPLTLLALLFIFRGLFAACIPAVVGVLAIVSTTGILRLITEVSEVSQLALNLTVLVGLGLAIDYGLLLVSRFREERTNGRPVGDAVTATVRTAGKTIALSALFLPAGLASLLLFDQPYLRSFGYAAMAASAMAAFVSLTIVPAVLRLGGQHIDRLRLGRRRSRPSLGPSFWERLIKRVGRRPVAYAVFATLLLLALATPIRDIGLADSDHRGLAAGSAVKVANERLAREFVGLGDGVLVLVEPAAGSGATVSLASVEAVRAQTREVPNVVGAEIVGRDADGVVLRVRLRGADRTASARDAYRALRDLREPSAVRLSFGGETAATVEAVESVRDTVPYMLALMFAVTLLVGAFAFGSLVLAIKAVLVSALGLAATFGVLTWLFVGGHGADLLDLTVQPLVPAMAVLVVAIVFGLTTDYELFLMARMLEARAAGASTDEALRFGVVRTGRVVTCGALLFCIVAGAFVISDLTIMKFVAIGLVLGLFLDATIIRFLLVPSFVKLLGAANWWNPWRRPAHSAARPATTKEV